MQHSGNVMNLYYRSFIMKEREKVITEYFESWIIKDEISLEKTFSQNATYIESWGPAYRDKTQILSWFKDWNKENTVLEWNVIAFYHTSTESICEWYFKCDCGGNIDGFNGASIITFNENNEIVLIKEFQSKTPNIYPYD